MHTEEKCEIIPSAKRDGVCSKSKTKKCCDLEHRKKAQQFREGPWVKVQNCVLSKAFRQRDKKHKKVDVSDVQWKLNLIDCYIKLIHSEQRKFLDSPFTPELTEQRMKMRVELVSSTWNHQSSCFLEVCSLLLLLPQVGFDLVPEEQHAQLAVRGLVHGLGLHAHAVLLRRQLVSAVLLVPQVEQAAGRRPHHQEAAVEVLPVQVDVLAAPSFDIDVKSSWFGEKISHRKQFKSANAAACFHMQTFLSAQRRVHWLVKECWLRTLIRVSACDHNQLFYCFLCRAVWCQGGGDISDPMLPDARLLQQACSNLRLQTTRVLQSTHVPGVFRMPSSAHFLLWKSLGVSLFALICTATKLRSRTTGVSLCSEWYSSTRKSHKKVGKTTENDIAAMLHRACCLTHLSATKPRAAGVVFCWCWLQMCWWLIRPGPFYSAQTNKNTPPNVKFLLSLSLVTNSTSCFVVFFAWCELIVHTFIIQCRPRWNILCELGVFTHPILHLSPWKCS